MHGRLIQCMRDMADHRIFTSMNIDASGNQGISGDADIHTRTTKIVVAN
jgi:hypothetical protein